MHELGIASSLLEAVQSEAARHPGARVCKVGVKVGELAGVDPDALAFGFDVLTNGTEWQHLVLEIITAPRTHHCPVCDRSFHVVDYQTACPTCGSQRTECIGGEELNLAYLELEES